MILEYLPYLIVALWVVAFILIYITVCNTDLMLDKSDEKICPVIAMYCEHYRCRIVGRGVEVGRCLHGDNRDPDERNCTSYNCPKVKHLW